MKKTSADAFKGLFALTASIVLSVAPMGGGAFANEEPMMMNHIKGHKAGVTSLDFNLDGNRLLTSGKDGTIRTWNSETGEQVRYFGKNAHGESIAKYSPRDDFLVVKGNKGINIVDVNTGRPSRRLAGVDGSVNDLAISNDGQYIAAGGDGSVVMVWRVTDNLPLHLIEGHTGEITALQFSPDSEFLASVSRDGTVKIWEVATGYLAFSYRNDKPINALDFTQDGMTLALASDDVKIIEVKTGQVLHTLRDHKGPVIAVDYSPNGKYLATGSTDKTCKIWSTATGRVMNTLVQQEAAISAVAFDNKGYTLAVGCEKLIPVGTKASKNDTNPIVIWNVSSLYPDRRISLYVERELYHWQKKGEFEKGADYQARIEKIDLEAGRLFTKAFRKYADEIREGTQISTYNPETEQFTVTVPAIGKFVVNVPIEKAKMFKERFPELVYRNFIVEPNVVVPAKSSWELRKVELYLPSAKQSFHFSSMK